MQELISQYLHQYNEFKHWSPSHLAALFVSLSCIVMIPLYSKHYLSEKAQYRLGAAIGILIACSLLAWNLMVAASGNYSLQKDLPLQLCRFANLNVVLVMVWRKQWWFELLYFWALAGMLQASITPDLKEDYPHFLYFRYWIGHTGMILALVYAAVVYQMRPQFKHVLKAMVGINVFMLFAALVNVLIGANYFWICNKPPTASILDYLGPWPWYIFFAEFVALANFSLAYLPWLLVDYIQKKQSNTE
jgi:hypothetical integral membrane protein (TIGR02206 family)